VPNGMSFEMHGPMFDGSAVGMAQQMTDEIEQEVALAAGVKLIDYATVSFKNPTGHYVSMIDVEPFSGGYRVWDQGVVYGPWLAGRGSRNFPVTRFRGYRHWRRTSEWVRARWPEISRRVVNRWLPRMGGTGSGG
jgi:hypothetical protein